MMQGEQMKNKTKDMINIIFYTINNDVRILKHYIN